MSNIEHEILKSLKICGSCTNCKVLIWNEKAQMKPTQNLIKIKLLDSSYFFMVRCGWLKTAVNEPQFLEICKGLKHD